MEMKVRPPVRAGMVIQLSSAVQSRMNSNWELSLVGKFKDEWVPQAQTTQEHLAHAWNLAGKMEMKLYPNNTFSFKLDNAEDFHRVLAGGPYFVEDSLLMLQPRPRAVRPDHVRFNNRVAVWVTLTGGLPDELLHDQEFAVSAGQHVGKVVDFKVAVMCGRSTARVKAEIEADEPLLPGSHVDIGNGTLLWVGFRYDGLPRLCSNCNRIGHLDTDCRKTPFQAKRELSKRMNAVAKKLKVAIVGGDDMCIEESLFNGSSSRSPPQRRTISCPTDLPTTTRVFKRCKTKTPADPQALALTVVTPSPEPVFGSNQESMMLFGDFGPGSVGTYMDLDASGSEKEVSKGPKTKPNN